jgi:hypothetical protein
MAKVREKYARKQVIAEEERWRAEDDARTLRQAMEIKKDQKRFKKARQIISEQLAALKEAEKM